MIKMTEADRAKFEFDAREQIEKFKDRPKEYCDYVWSDAAFEDLMNGFPSVMSGRLEAIMDEEGCYPSLEMIEIFVAIEKEFFGASCSDDSQEWYDKYEPENQSFE
jgi:hypothetical protein